MTELTLHIPSDKELSYRSYLILDEATMSYNMGYGDNGGCTYHKTAEELYEWYQYWIDFMPTFKEIKIMLLSVK